jgi:putative transposase
LHKDGSYRLAESAVVIGDLSQRQMVLKQQEEETPKDKRKRQIRNRMVYNDWGVYGFVQMLIYKCLRSGKVLYIISERDTSKTCSRCGHKQAMPLWKRMYRCPNCGLVMDRDDNSAINLYQRFVAGLRPHTSCGKCGVLYEGGNRVEATEVSCHVLVQQLELWTDVIGV